MECNCKICGKRFWSMNKRAEHMKLAHGVEAKVRPMEPKEEEDKPGILAAGALAVEAVTLQPEEPAPVEKLFEGEGGESGGGGATGNFEAPLDMDRIESEPEPEAEAANDASEPGGGGDLGGDAA